MYEWSQITKVLSSLYSSEGAQLNVDLFLGYRSLSLPTFALFLDPILAKIQMTMINERMNFGRVKGFCDNN